MIEEKIIADIKEQRCILFLGPLMTAVRYKGVRTSLTKLVCDHITEELVTENVIANNPDVNRNPYYIMAKYINHLGEERFESKFETIKNQFFEMRSSVYQLLSKIPFNTIINFGSDYLMERALRRGGYEFCFAYYNYNGDKIEYLNDPNDEKQGLDDKIQLVYNLLGSIYDTQSLVLTEDDQLEFLRQIAGDKKIPNNVLSRIKDDDKGKSYIFLGFNFEDWPFRFLLDLLQIKKVKSSASPKSEGYNIALMTQEFYQERFGVHFLNSRPEEFAKELVTEYNKGRFEHRYGYISYDESDTEVAKAFIEILLPTGLNRRIKFWDKSGLVAGDVREEEIQLNRSRASIYIAFITTRFINDPVLRKEMKDMLANPDVLVFPIITKNCDYQSQFPDLKNRKRVLMLPSKTGVLVSASKQPADEDYLSMVRKINSNIR